MMMMNSFGNMSTKLNRGSGIIVIVSMLSGIGDFFNWIQIVLQNRDCNLEIIFYYRDSGWIPPGSIRNPGIAIPTRESKELTVRVADWSKLKLQRSFDTWPPCMMAALRITAD